MSINSFFDGIGTELISIVIGLIVCALGGGIVFYKIGIQNKISQKQISGNLSKQKQEVHIKDEMIKHSSSKKNDRIQQYQKAGYKSIQTQIARSSLK